MTAEPIAIGIDIGGTNLRAAAVASDGELCDRFRSPTPSGSAGELLEAIDGVLSRLPGSIPVGIGIAGLVSREGIVRYGPNIAIRDLPLAAALSERDARPITVINDASAAAFGEQQVGVAAGGSDVVMFTLGTGVGGGVVVDGRLVLGRSGFAGELGHVVVCEDGRPCPCGNRGCLEAYASGTAIASLASELLASDDRPSVLRRTEPPDAVTVSSAARQGDVVATAVLEDVGGWLGVAAATLANVFDPQMIVIGGGVGAATADQILPVATRMMQQHVVGLDFRTPPPLVRARLGDDAGIVGAGLYAARQHLEAGAGR